MGACHRSHHGKPKANASGFPISGGLTAIEGFKYPFAFALRDAGAHVIDLNDSVPVPVEHPSGGAATEFDGIVQEVCEKPTQAYRVTALNDLLATDQPDG